MKGKRVLIAGGTSSLGLGVTSEAIARGAEVTIPYIHERESDRLKQILSPADFAKIQFIPANLTNEGSVKNLIDRMERVDVLINLVGSFAMGKTHQYSFNDWKKNFDLNVNTTFLLCKYSLEKMLQHGYGRIVTVGARDAWEPVGELAAYCASKAAVVALTKAIAHEMKDTNITANIVLPSLIDPPANREAIGDENAERWAKPQSLVQVICFLGSAAAGDLRGVAVPVCDNI